MPKSTETYKLNKETVHRPSTTAVFFGIAFSHFTKPMLLYLQGAFEKFGEWSHKIKETMYTNKIPILAFKVIIISYNTLLTSVVQLLETGVSKRFCRYRSKHRCHTLLDLRNVGKA
ncbi:hypothetical protein AVEN_91873-1 [Araneus ventricosus]|uniref:Uncharacterized protein n=1 Tax=Araneus ventricosus TaxID=182803 RepID=A0A4Y2G8F1_ARAVE|nr:hypothetical protein AVEN_91873-1 [Araneus ventricosus]